MKNPKATLVLLAKILVSGGLLFFLFTKIHIERFLSTLTDAKVSYVIIAMLIYFATQIISALRWQVLAQPLGFDRPFRTYVVDFLIGMFFNLFAPGTVGGDVSRIYYLAQGGIRQDENIPGGPTMHAAVSVLVDRCVWLSVLFGSGDDLPQLSRLTQKIQTGRLATYSYSEWFATLDGGIGHRFPAGIFS